MNETLSPPSAALGVFSEPATLTIQRRLPGPIERVWSYLTDSDLRRRWLAAGTMTLQPGAPFELVWRNEELSDTPSRRPEGFSAEQRMTCRITAAEPPHRLAFDWPGVGEVSIRLQAQGDAVLLTLVHARLPDHGTSVMVGAGWHAHLDLLVACVEGTARLPFWEAWTRLRGEYERLAAG